MNSGIKKLELDDEELACLLEKRLKIDMLTNQYLFITDRKNKVIMKQRWNGEELLPLKYNKIKSKRFPVISPRNDEQEALFDLLQNTSITIKSVTGIAGSGKNYCAMTYALDQIDNYENGHSSYRKIVLIRNNIEVKNTNNLGALPSGIDEKLLPFAMPAVDLLGDQNTLFYLIENGKIELVHLGFVRGRNFDNAIVIVDESENLTAEHVALLVSRIGNDSTIIFLGDTSQTDKPVFEKNSGLEKLNSRLLGNELFGSVHLIKTERSKTAALASLLT